MKVKSLLIALLGSTCIAGAVSAAPMARTGDQAMVPSRAAQRFMTNAIQGDNAEIALGDLAEQKASRQDVKDIGHQLAQDHTTAKQQAVSIASGVNVQPTDAISAEGQREMRKLGRLTGAAFDREFVSYMVRDHSKDIATFNREARRNDGAVSDFARQSVPTLQKHLDVARNLEKVRSSQR